MPNRPIRLAVRAVILHENRLLLVNAWPGNVSDLWCAPGGGVEKGSSLPDNLKRELREECGVDVSVGAPCLVNEFHNPNERPNDGFHQVEIFFRCQITSAIPSDWIDPEGIVNRRKFWTKDEVQRLHLKPDSLRHVPWDKSAGSACYDALELLTK